MIHETLPQQQLLHQRNKMLHCFDPTSDPPEPDRQPKEARPPRWHCHHKGAIEIEIFEDGVISEVLVPEGHEVPVGTVLATVSDEVSPEVVVLPRLEPQETMMPASNSERGSEVPPVTHTGQSGDSDLGRDSDLFPASVKENSEPLIEAKRLQISPLARRRAREYGLSHADLLPVLGTGPGGALSVRDIEKCQKQNVDETLNKEMSLSPHAGPTVRQRALEQGISLEGVKGSGPHGLITPADLPQIPKEKSDPMRAAIAAAMSRSKREIPHYYLGHSIDMEPALSWMESFNQERPISERLIYAVLLMKAVALVLRKFKDLNGFCIEGVFQPSEQIDVGMAISLRTGGLVAPALKNVDQKDLQCLMAEFKDLVNRARSNQLRASEMKGGSITLTNLGEQGVEFVYPVIYPPQVAMVGFGSVLDRPWVVDGEIKPRRVLTASLAGDHRVSDGRRGAMFLSRLEKRLRKPEKL